MNLPDDLQYAPTHEWVRPQGDVLLVGISDPAQDMLGDVVFVEARVGARLGAGEVAGTVESVKAASDIHAPVAGEIVAFNDALAAEPGLLNGDPYGTWIFQLRPDDAAARAGLLDAAGYRAVVEAA
ncbi:glycine cleavage system protein GcvH [Verticiella sediminum]|uniref:Glycine cleavage system H protein n=1 Tax=Verticiella sediminum TaxID=1247510 RepID=A0A556A7V9_9BURK|nr:glycine cleavage system protein GcvH [Verticiella sediminum]TSH88979.1 glycine cleavage system protein GcvH [Verticiella sediminum]